MIPDYLESLARELDFDRSLSRCVRQEVEDHLWEAVAADATGNTPQAQQRAIASFGDAAPSPLSSRSSRWQGIRGEPPSPRFSSSLAI